MGGTASQRVAAIIQLAQTLKRVADQMQVAVIAISQIDKVHSAPVDQPVEGDFSSVKAALGTSWRD